MGQDGGCPWPDPADGQAEGWPQTAGPRTAGPRTGDWPPDGRPAAGHRTAGHRTARRVAGPRRATATAGRPDLTAGPGPMAAAGSRCPLQRGADGRAPPAGDAPKAVTVHGNAFAGIPQGVHADLGLQFVRASDHGCCRCERGRRRRLAGTSRLPAIGGIATGRGQAPGTAGPGDRRPRGQRPGGLLAPAGGAGRRYHAQGAALPLRRGRGPARAGHLPAARAAHRQRAGRHRRGTGRADAGGAGPRRLARPAWARNPGCSIRPSG